MSDFTQRPRLEPYPYNTGPGPLSPAWRDPEPPFVASAWPVLDGPGTPTPVLEALARKLETLRAECIAATRAREAFPVSPVGRSDIEALNRALVAVQQLNAALHRPRRSSEVAGWTHPVLPTTVLLAPRDLIGALDCAIRVLAGTIAEADIWIYTHG